MAYDNTHVWVVYNVLTAPQMTQISDNIDWLHTQLTSAAGVNGVSSFYPSPLQIDSSNQGAVTANRVYATRIHLEAQCKVDGFYGYGGNATNTRWGAGIYDVAGTTLLCSGVTAQLAAVAIPITCAATLIPAGTYWLAMTGDAQGLLAAARIAIGNNQLATMNSPDVTFGYSATASAAGVLPATIALPLTAVSTQGAAMAIWAIHTTTY